MSTPTKRLIVEIRDGQLQRIVADGIDLTGVLGVLIDNDTDGADEENIQPFGTETVYFCPMNIEQATDEFSRDVRRAYDTWVLS